jgi:hypothetical protein
MAGGLRVCYAEGVCSREAPCFWAAALAALLGMSCVLHQMTVCVDQMLMSHGVAHVCLELAGWDCLSSLQ